MRVEFWPHALLPMTRSPRSVTMTRGFINFRSYDLSGSDAAELLVCLKGRLLNCVSFAGRGEG
jgi:hypothetical protein